MSAYLKDLVERTVSSFAGGCLSVTGLEFFNVLQLDWKAALGVGGGAAVVAVLKGLTAFKIGDRTAALLPKEK